MFMTVYLKLNIVHDSLYTFEVTKHKKKKKSYLILLKIM